MKKLICKKCNGTLFDTVEHGVFTVNPPIPYTVYRCEKCGERITVETRPEYVAPKAEEVILGENDYVPSVRESINGLWADPDGSSSTTTSTTSADPSIIITANN